LIKELEAHLLFDIATSLDDNKLINAFIDIHPDLCELVDGNGWSLAWIRYVNGLASPDNGPAGNNNTVQMTPDASGFDFKVPTQWQKPGSWSGFSVSYDGDDKSILSISERDRFRREQGSGFFHSFYRPSLLRSNYPIPPVGSFVFKMQILEKGSKG
jgi:hypothetical protein